MQPQSPALLILAAGLGSRYGGLKQFEGMGPSGETLLDYAIFDAKQAGFARVVLVVKPGLDPQIQSELCHKFHGRVDIDFVAQDLHDLPNGVQIPAGRTRPWGTLHAVLAARHAIRTPFAVINGDDYYGPEAYRRAAAFLNQATTTDSRTHRYCMVGYQLDHTLSPHGGVNRGICRHQNGLLESVEEHVRIVADDTGGCYGFKLDGARVDLPGQALASMNFWGFTPAIFGHMQAHFSTFLATQGQSTDAECYIPSVVDHLLRTQQADCHVLSTGDHWFGITYAHDRAQTATALRSLTAAGVYPTPLWPAHQDEGRAIERAAKTPFAPAM